MRPAYKCVKCGEYTEEPLHCGRPARLLLDPTRRLRLSRLMSGLLRHFPEAAGLRPDSSGYVALEDLVRAVRGWSKSDYSWVTIDHVLAVARLDPKGRFEVVDGKVRATYGHSYRIAPRYPVVSRPGKLYHGTQAEKLPSIMRDGLRPMKRLYVHLTKSISDAWETARRRSGTPVVLVVDGDGLAASGLKVYKASETVYLVRHVPPRFIAGVLRKRL